MPSSQPLLRITNWKPAKKVRDKIRRDHDRQHRRLKQADIMFISQHLKTSYKLPEFHLTNVKHLIPKNNQIVARQQPQRIAPAIFTIPNMMIKKEITRISFLKKETIQYQSDISREDREKQAKLVKELKDQLENGEKDLVIHKSCIVPKNQQWAGLGTFPSSLV